MFQARHVVTQRPDPIRDRCLALRDAHEEQASRQFFCGLSTPGDLALFAMAFALGWKRAAPAHQLGLSDERIDEIALQYFDGDEIPISELLAFRELARAIEDAHGIPLKEPK